MHSIKEETSCWFHFLDGLRILAIQKWPLTDFVENKNDNESEQSNKQIQMKQYFNWL